MNNLPNFLSKWRGSTPGKIDLLAEITDKLKKRGIDCDHEGDYIILRKAKLAVRLEAKWNSDKYWEEFGYRVITLETNQKVVSAKFITEFAQLIEKGQGGSRWVI